MHVDVDHEFFDRNFRCSFLHSVHARHFRDILAGLSLLSVVKVCPRDNRPVQCAEIADCSLANKHVNVWSFGCDPARKAGNGHFLAKLGWWRWCEPQASRQAMHLHTSLHRNRSQIGFLFISLYFITPQSEAFPGLSVWALPTSGVSCSWTCGLRLRDHSYDDQQQLLP